MRIYKNMTEIVEYTVSLKHPETHTATIVYTIPKKIDKLIISIPNWTPGSYVIRDFGRYIEMIETVDDISMLIKIDKNHWLVTNKGGNQIKIEYTVYMGELSVRTSYMDKFHAQIIPASSFIYSPVYRDAPVRIKFDIPEHWRIFTSLKFIDKNTLYSENYDELVDSPIDISGNVVKKDFIVNDKSHSITLCNFNKKIDYAKILKNSKKIVLESYKIFNDWPNMKKYHFSFHIGTRNSGGGLEHINSSSIMLPAEAFNYNDIKKYNILLSVIAHEYFHMWNVKGLRTKKLIPYNYDSEVYTETLWFHEGFTNYYGNIIPLRAKCYDIGHYIEYLGKAISSYRNKPGRLIQSVADSSFDSWIKFYKPTPDSVNSTVSYYEKGELIALILNLYIIKNSDGKYSLDDLMAYMWKNYKTSGFDEKNIVDIMDDALDTISLRNIIKKLVYTTDEIDFKRYLSYVGLLQDMKKKDNPYIGLEMDGELKLKVVYRGSPAEKAGLCPADELIAIDDIRATGENVNDLILHLSPDRKYRLIVSRNGMIHTADIIPDQPLSDVTISLSKKPTYEQKRYFTKMFKIPYPNIKK
ncbi:MAG: hypothetical protein M1411_01895 [Candidatus Thermoplasmatota archaeon]|nr:hypothetical protein [Candidatus Thermoplasmatota archaeon]